jgi:hypothetical protein
MYWKKISLALLPIVVFAIYFNTILKPQSYDNTRRGILHAEVTEIYSAVNNSQTNYFLENIKNELEKINFSQPVDLALVGREVILEGEYKNHQYNAQIKQVVPFRDVASSGVENSLVLLFSFQDSPQINPLNVSHFTDLMFKGEFQKTYHKLTNHQFVQVGKVIGWNRLERKGDEDGDLAFHCNIKNNEIAEIVIGHYIDLKKYDSMMILTDCPQVESIDSKLTLSKIPFLGHHLKILKMSIHSDDWGQTSELLQNLARLKQKELVKAH